MNNADILNSLNQDGCSLVPNVFSPDFMDTIATDIDIATKYCLDIQRKQQVGSDTNIPESVEGGNGALGGAAHHVICFERSFFQLLQQKPLFELIEDFLGKGPFILNSFGAVTNTNQNNMYEHGKTIHRDCRSFQPSFKQQCWLLVMV